MHEVVYLQFGNLPNFIGTHFWNAQDAYSEEEADQQISWSLREGDENAPLLRPRVLIFDWKQNFGTLLKNGIYSERSTLEVPVNTWNGLTHTYSAPKIPQSNYLIQLEETVDEEDDNEKLDPPASKDVRYWSDYNHIYFLPESIHPLSTSRPQSNGEDQEVRWTEGCELFGNYERENDLMDTSLRRLTEDCDSLQAFQTILDVPSFAGFGLSLLEKIADEYPKRARIDFNHLSTFDTIMGNQNNMGIEHASLITNCLSLHKLLNFSDLSVPLLPRSMWAPGAWKGLVPGLEGSLYHTSALYTAQIESISWPVRKMRSNRRWDNIVGILNQDRNTPFAGLAGIMPVMEMIGQREHWWDYRLDLSIPKMNPRPEEDTIKQFSVARNISEKTLLEEFKQLSGSKDEDATAYPIPLSHPQFFNSSLQGQHTRSVSTLSSLAVRPTFGRVLERHALWCERYIRKGSSLASSGLDTDELKEVAEGLRATGELYAEFGDEHDKV